MKKCIQFGAGNIGRGFLAELFYEAGYEIVYIEVNKRMIEAINKKKSFRLKIVGVPSKNIIIKNIRAVDANDIKKTADEIKNADIIATAVGVNFLKNIAPLLAEGIKKRAESDIKTPVNIIICENLLDAAHILKKNINKYLNSRYRKYLDENAGFVETVVSRMIPVVPEKTRKKDPLFIMAEKYNILPVAKKGFKGKIPKIDGMLPREDLIPYEEMKLFGHNLGHAILAYLGYLKNYKYIWQSIRDKEIREITKKALFNESGKALIKKHHIPKAEYKKYIDDLIRRFENKALGDTVFRVGRDPIRKLGFNDRLIGSARLCLEQDIIPYNICLGIKAALLYNYKDDEYSVQLQNKIKKHGIDKVIKDICQINPNSRLGKLIKDWRE